MIRTIQKYICMDCKSDHGIIMCDNGVDNIDLCLDCFLEREEQEREEVEECEERPKEWEIRGCSSAQEYINFIKRGF